MTTEVAIVCMTIVGCFVAVFIVLALIKISDYLDNISKTLNEILYLYTATRR